MRIVLELDDSFAVAAYIENVTNPTQKQAQALRELALHAGDLQCALFPEGRFDA